MGWETVDLDDLTPEQRRTLRDLQRHGSMNGVPSRTHSRLDLSRLGSFEATDPDAISSIEEVVGGAVGEATFDLQTNAVEEATREYIQEQEAAILGTNWERWDIVDLVEWTPVTPSDLPRFEVHRYEDDAPPVSTYATGEQRYSVTRVTEPLLRRIFGRLREDDALPERYEHYADELEL